jgi:hypothetical protein
MGFPSRGVGSHRVEGHTDPCIDRELPDRDEIRDFVLEHLQSRGFDLSRDVKQAEQGSALSGSGDTPG